MGKRADRRKNSIISPTGDSQSIAKEVTSKVEDYADRQYIPFPYKLQIVWIAIELLRRDDFLLFMPGHFMYLR